MPDRFVRPVELDPTKFGFVARVPGDGPVPSEIMVLGEYPGKIESKTGIPFSGATRGWLEEFLRVLGKRRDQVFVTLAVQRPRVDARGVIRAATPDEAIKDKPLVAKEIEKVDPKIVLIFGRIAEDTWAARLRADGRLVYVFLHPSHFMRRQDWDGWMEQAKEAARRIVRQKAFEALKVAFSQ